jgi:cholesterol oxidase
MDHFDVIVTGSGFGGSVSAYRLAAGGLSVCVLERGHPWPPNSFPRDPARLARNLWDPHNGLYGMFDVWSFRGLEAVVSSGLGGGSLIYANVLIRKDEHWFVKEDTSQPGYEYWPITRADLDPHYDTVEKMLNAQTYPFDRAPYNSTAKTQAMKDAAAALGLEWQLPNLAVTFANKDRPPALGECVEGEPANLHHATRTTCRLCGECDIGCNYGAKNTLDYNYLSRAKDQGAVLRTLCEVKRIDPGPRGGYVVTYVQHDATGRAGSTPSHVAVHADKLILAAGTFGSPYLLLRNRAAFPALSPALGTHFSGNGDLLTFIDRARGADGQPRALDPSIGPVITSAIRVADELDGVGVHGRGFYVEDGGNPAFLDYLEGMSSAPSIGFRGMRFVLRRVWAHATGNPRSNYSAQLSEVFGGGDRSSPALPLLTMGRDVPDGVMSLGDEDLELDWTTHNSDSYFDRVQTTVARIAHALGGRYSNTPLWLFKRVITVHPLGGCPMGRDRSEGVVDSFGEVFGYPGLYVADGSVMPGPVGPNPSLTIAAFADRLATAILSGRKGADS